METLADLRSRHAGAGRLAWIGLRPARHASVQAVDHVQVMLSGLEGDHARPGRRAVTVIQAEHIPVIASLAKVDELTPDMLRRNLVISGINLAALKARRIAVGEAVLEVTAPCAPCSRMERTLGPGGYNAMRGHGGFYAEVVSSGAISIGSEVLPV